MGRKKKEENVPEEKEAKFSFDDILESDAKRSIAAVFLFALAVIFLLSFFDAAGKLGEMLDSGFGLVFGFGKWLLPILFIVSGIFFLRRRSTTLADGVKFVGLLIAFVSFLGLIHLYGGDTPSELLKWAKKGGGGGYLGFGLATFFLSFTGRIAGTVILLGLFSIGIIAAFNVSLMHWIDRIRARYAKKEEDQEVEASESSPVESKSESLLLVDAGENEMLVRSEESLSGQASVSDEHASISGNIKNISFGIDESLEKSDVSESSEGSPSEGMSDFSISDTSDVSPKKRRKHKVYWDLPPTDMLESTSGEAAGGDVERNKHIIQSTLKYFGIDVEPGEVKVGPTVTQYTFRPGIGVKLSRITTLSNDLALALAAESIRIEAPIPGQSFIGIEIPNRSKAMVRMRSIVENRKFRDQKYPLSLGIGQDVTGDDVFADLDEMPHLLIAGRTKSGKSVCVNAILMSLLYKNSPEDLKLILVDPKRVELSIYKGIPHLKTEVIVDAKKVVNALGWAIGEMERRYKLLEAVHVRDLPAYHELCRQGFVKTVFDERTGVSREESLENLPFIVIIIDELAELMVAHGKEIEPKVVRLAQMARAVGIHLILATQRPSVEVITGLIKTNLPTRIAFQVSSQIDSRTILDQGGAEKLLGNGDMLYMASDGNMQRLQGVYVSTDEVRRVTNFWREQKRDHNEAEDSLEDDITGNGTSEGSSGSGSGPAEAQDDLYEQAKDLFIRSQKASTTSLQTAFGIGYPRAARLMHLLEETNVVGMVDGKKQVLIGRDMVSASDPNEKTETERDPLAEQAERDTWQV